MVELLLFIVGVVVLVYGADRLVDGASALANRYGVPNIVIGLTIVAFGTSTPELIVNVFASYNHSAELALGNIIGSNIFNIMGILGLSALICPLTVRKNTVWLEIPLALLAAVVAFLMANDSSIEGQTFSQITRIDGAILLCFFMIFMAYNMTVALEGNHDNEEGFSPPSLSSILSSFYIVLGLCLLVLGGQLIVHSATSIARAWHISERVIGLTIVSIGTSLPELATSVVAAYKKSSDIAIGNIVGSNIFNTFFILGISALISPLPLSAGSNVDLIVNILSSLLLFLFLFIGKRHTLQRSQGLIFLFCYLVYLAWLIALPVTSPSELSHVAL